MKKSLVAIAVLVASGASFAQSSVTLYGLADLWFGSFKTTNGVTGNSVTTTKIDSGGVNTSRWGMKGSEDLGGGLKANFVLEQGFNLDNGAGNVAGQAFSRYAYVGFSGGFGEIKLGKTGTAYDDVQGASDAVFDSALSPMNHVFASTGYNWTAGNSIYYQAPNMGGFSGAISYALDEKVPGAAKTTSLALTYGAGPIAVQLAYQVEDKENLTAGSADAKFTRLGGSYDFGVAALKANYGKVNNVNGLSGRDATDYQIGVDVPVGKALTVSASYAKSDDSNVGFEQSRKGYGIGAAYTLSKRTFLYGGYTDNKATNAVGGDDKVSILAVGVQHKF